jgi:hypothetical protein
MKVSLVQDQAITARMALIVGADNFDRLFRGVQFDEFDGTVCMFTLWTSIERRKSKTRLPFIYRLSRLAFLSAIFLL